MGWIKLRDDTTQVTSLNLADRILLIDAQGETREITVENLYKWMAETIALDLGESGTITINSNQVVGARVVDARADDTCNSGDATTDGVIDALRDAMIAHGLIAAS